MAYVVDKANPTQGVRYSVNSPDYSTDDFWINPTLPPNPIKYWKNDAGTLAEMTVAEKTVVDDAEVDATAKSSALANIRKGEKAIANWKVNKSIEALSASDRKFIDKKLEDVFNSVYAGSLTTASDLLANDTTASGALTQDLIDGLKTEIDNQI